MKKSSKKVCKIKTFSYEQKLIEYTASRSALQEVLKEFSIGWKSIIPETDLDLIKKF